MARPPLEVADLIRAAGAGLHRTKPKWLTWLHLKVLTAIERCRTSALGGHRRRVFPLRTSRHLLQLVQKPALPKVPGQRARPLAGSAAQELLPTATSMWSSRCRANSRHWPCRTRRIIYGLLFRASAETLLEVARDPKHLGADIGFFSVLHTWNQKLQHHPHVHCVVPAGGLASRPHAMDRLATGVLSAGRCSAGVFRGKFVDGLKELHAEHKLSFHGTLTGLTARKAFAAWLRPLFRSEWVVYAKRPFGGAEHALRYLGRYTHRVAISNHRLVSLDDGIITFRWRDSAHKNKKRLMTLPVDEFLRRFLLHVLPRGFVRIRHFGFLAHRRRRALLPLCIRLLAESGRARVEAAPEEAAVSSSSPLWTCPQCGGPMVLIGRLTAVELRLRSPPLPADQQP